MESKFKTQVWPKTSLDELRDAAAAIARQIPPRCTVLFSGPMGVGKTTLIRMIAEACGCGEVSSPTYAIHQSYRADHRRIEHFDLYRLNGEDEIETSGLWDILSSKQDQWVLIEWPERIDASRISGVVLRLDLTLTTLSFGPL